MTIIETPAPIVPVATDPPAPPVVPPASPAAAPTSGAEVKLTSDALKARLAEERRAGERAFLAKYGVEKPEDLDAKLKKLSEHEASQLSERERIEKQIAELTRQADAAKGLGAVANAAVQELFDALPEHARVAIEELQPATPAERHKLVQTYRKMVAAAAQDAASKPAGTPPPNPPPAPPPAPASTANAPPPPKPGSKSKYQEYEDLKARNNVAAGLFYQANRQAIEASRPTA